MNEQRLCLGSLIEDGQMQSEVNIWHSACDSIVNFTPTTPPISTITASYSVDMCHSIGNECASASLADERC